MIRELGGRPKRKHTLEKCHIQDLCTEICKVVQKENNFFIHLNGGESHMYGLEDSILK